MFTPSNILTGNVLGHIIDNIVTNAPPLTKATRWAMLAAIIASITLTACELDSPLTGNNKLNATTPTTTAPSTPSTIMVPRDAFTIDNIGRRKYRLSLTEDKELNNAALALVEEIIRKPVTRDRKNSMYVTYQTSRNQQSDVLKKLDTFRTTASKQTWAVWVYEIPVTHPLPIGTTLIDLTEVGETLQVRELNALPRFTNTKQAANGQLHYLSGARVGAKGTYQNLQSTRFVQRLSRAEKSTSKETASEEKEKLAVTMGEYKTGMVVHVTGNTNKGMINATVSVAVKSLKRLQELTEEGDTLRKPIIETQEISVDLQAKPGDILLLSGIKPPINPQTKTALTVDPATPGSRFNSRGLGPAQQLQRQLQGPAVATELVVVLQPKLTKYAFTKVPEPSRKALAKVAPAASKKPALATLKQLEGPQPASKQEKPKTPSISKPMFAMPPAPSAAKQANKTSQGETIRTVQDLLENNPDGKFIMKKPAMQSPAATLPPVTAQSLPPLSTPTNIPAGVPPELTDPRDIAAYLGTPVEALNSIPPAGSAVAASPQPSTGKQPQLKTFGKKKIRLSKDALDAIAGSTAPKAAQSTGGSLKDRLRAIAPYQGVIVVE